MNNFIRNFTKNQLFSSQEIISEIVNELIQNSTENKNLQSDIRSGCLSQKSTDLQSTNTMPGTFQTEKSEKHIQDIINSRTDTQTTNNTNTNQIKQTSLSFDKNGYMFTSLFDITKIKYYFIKVAVQFGMIVMRNLQNVLTIKTQRMSSLKCILLMCLPMGSEDSIYQLERYKSTKGSKLKLTLISGNEDTFYQFCKIFYYKLWKKDILQLNNYEILNLLCYIYKNNIIEITNRYKQQYNKLDYIKYQKQIQISNIQQLLIKLFKISLNNLYQAIFNQNQNKCINKNYQNYTIIQRIVMNQIPIYQFYSKIQNNHNLQFLEKRNNIIQSFSLKMVLQHLEIDEKMIGQQPYNYNKKIKEILEENYPFSQAINLLNALSISLSANDNIKYITNFENKLIETCKIKLDKMCYCMLDMDNQLPLTIFCVLLSKNEKLKAIITFLQNYFQNQDLFSTENRILTTLNVSFQYIRNQWNFLDQLNQ